MENSKIFFRNKIIEWGKSYLRKFPWRENKSPYRVLIGELFLQKTNIKQVENVYLKFIEKFPDPIILASAENDEIIDIIFPLGLYNRRAKVLKILSQQLIENYSGNIPETYNDLIKLYGIDRYMANAFLSFYNEKKVPIVDSNIIRIFERFFNVKSDQKDKARDPKLWEFAEQLLPEKECQHYNYSLLDFCIMICKPKNPKCEECILSSNCFNVSND